MVSIRANSKVVQKKSKKKGRVPFPSLSLSITIINSQMLNSYALKIKELILHNNDKHISNI